MTNARIDSLTYEYYPKTNQLRRIVDHTSHSMEDAFGDLTTQTDTVTYEYDAIGQLVIDRAENQRIVWNPDHTVKEVRALDTDRLKLAFVYDDKGNRVQKRTYKTDGSLDKTTYYFRDMEGNVMGVYSQQNDTLRATEHTVYANGRLGLANRDTAGVAFTYELTDHLGNVRAVIDRKTLNAAAGGDTSGVSPEVAMMADYYPFGWEMPGRKLNEDDYRYGFNGKETDPETGWQDYGFRLYNPRVARFFRVDPLSVEYPRLTPYQFASNTPIQAIDLDGLEAVKINLQQINNVAFYDGSVQYSVALRHTDVIMYKVTLTFDPEDGSPEVPVNIPGYTNGDVMLAQPKDYHKDNNILQIGRVYQGYIERGNPWDRIKILGSGDVMAQVPTTIHAGRFAASSKGCFLPCFSNNFDFSNVFGAENSFNNDYDVSSDIVSSLIYAYDTIRGGDLWVTSPSVSIFDDFSHIDFSKTRIEIINHKPDE